MIKRQKIQKDKMKIIFNKVNLYSIGKDVLKIMFSDFEILGNISQDNFYNLMVNTNLKIVKKKTEKEYKKIIKNLKV